MEANRSIVFARTGSAPLKATFQHESVGGWAACRSCSELIEAGRWAELTDRAFTNFLKQHCAPRYSHFDVREQFREIHHLFKENLVKES